MTGTLFSKALAAFAVSVGVSITLVAPALAQNRDGAVMARFGVFGQGQYTNIDGTIIPVPPSTGAPFSNSVSTNFYGLGLSGGLDWHTRGIVLGIESDFSANGGSVGIGPAKYMSAYLATVRGRAGVKLMPDLLVYGTAGLGLLATDIRIDTTGAKSQKTLPGFIYGLGLEREWKNVIFFGEYLHSDFGRNSARIDQSGLFGVSSSAGFDTGYDANVFRLGMKFKVGHDHSHDHYADGSSVPPLK
jgi:opacity protein-like surface antigen